MESTPALVHHDAKSLVFVRRLEIGGLMRFRESGIVVHDVGGVEKLNLVDGMTRSHGSDTADDDGTGVPFQHEIGKMEHPDGPVGGPTRERLSDFLTPAFPGRGGGGFVPRLGSDGLNDPTSVQTPFQAVAVNQARETRMKCRNVI